MDFVPFSERSYIFGVINEGKRYVIPKEKMRMNIESIFGSLTDCLDF